jgi:hypothetical protein
MPVQKSPRRSSSHGERKILLVLAIHSHRFLPEKFNAVEIDCAVADHSGNTGHLVRTRTFEFQLDGCSDRQIGDRKEIHATFTKLDAKSLDGIRTAHNPNWCHQRIALPAPFFPIAKFQEHA